MELLRFLPIAPWLRAPLNVVVFLVVVVGFARWLPLAFEICTRIGASSCRESGGTRPGNRPRALFSFWSVGPAQIVGLAVIVGKIRRGQVVWSE